MPRILRRSVKAELSSAATSHTSIGRQRRAYLAKSPNDIRLVSTPGLQGGRRQAHIRHASASSRFE